MKQFVCNQTLGLSEADNINDFGHENRSWCATCIKGHQNDFQTLVYFQLVSKPGKVM